MWKELEGIRSLIEPVRFYQIATEVKPAGKQMSIDLAEHEVR